MLSWLWKKVFGSPTGNYRVSPPWRSIREIDGRNLEQFSAFMRGLPEALPSGAVLRITPSSRDLEPQYRRLEGSEQVVPGGLLLKPRSVFWLSLSSSNVEGLCRLRSLEMNHTRAMNIEVLETIHSGEAIMDWCVMGDHEPWFSARADVERLRELAARCNAVLSDELTPENVPRLGPWIQIRREERKGPESVSNPEQNE